MQTHIGELAALTTAFCWTITALSFEIAAKKVGSLALNLIRLLLAFIFLSLYSYLVRGLLFPVDASSHAWIWLSISGIIGFSLGGLFLFKAFVVIGARVSMLMMSSVPLWSTLIGWLVLGESLSFGDWLGMTLTIIGIALVILHKKGQQLQDSLKRPAS